MSRICQVTGKRPLYGNKVSHSNRKTRRRQQVNLQKHRFWSDERRRWVSLKVSAAGVRVINKRGLEPVLKELEQRGEKF